MNALWLTRDRCAYPVYSIIFGTKPMHKDGVWRKGRNGFVCYISCENWRGPKLRPGQCVRLVPQRARLAGEERKCGADAC